MNKEKSFHIETFGCQMNVNDSEKVAGLLLAHGHRRAAGPEDADFVFINTCAVREKASEKLYHALGRLQKEKRRRELVIGVGGCVAQLSGREILDRAPQVDLLVGTHNVARVPDMLRGAGGGAATVVDLDRTADTFTIPTAAVAHSSPVRAYVTVIEGCNHVCSFCVVPRTRGPEVCRDAQEVVDEVAALVGRGYPEVMLLGQTVNAYRRDGLDFAGLLERVNAVPGLQRLRFTTSHPEHVDARLAEAMGALDKVCPYLHLPVQSGSDRILADMRRGYTSGEYREKAAMLRAAVPGLALTSDIIVGYPTEDEAAFEETVALVEDMEFAGVFVFTYSPRPGTTAFRREDDVPPAEKSRRLQIINERQQRFQAIRNAERVGRREEVLIDTVGEDRRISGRTRDFRIVHCAGSAADLGRTIFVDTTGSGPNSLHGRPADISVAAVSANLVS